MDRLGVLLRAGLVTLVPVFVAGCQGGGANPPPVNTGTPAPVGTLSALPSSLTFSAPGGAPYNQTVTITASVPIAAPAISSTCGTGASAIVSFGTPSGSGLSFTDTVTPLNAGTCSATISGAGGASATVTFTVNSSSVTVSNRNHRV